MEPKVSIVIINWNSWHHLEECLSELRKLNYPNFEIVISDNGSTDTSLELVEQKFPEAIILRNNGNLGSSGGNNMGMKYAVEHGSEYVWLLNNDAISHPDTLKILVEQMEKDPRIGLMSPVLYDYHNRNNIQSCGASLDRKKYKICQFDQFEQLENVSEKDFWVWSTAVLIKAEVIKNIGYMSDRIFVYCDDMEYSFRAIKHGYICALAKEAAVYHKSHYSGNERKLPPHYYYYMTRNHYFFWKALLPWYRRIPFMVHYLSHIFELVGNEKLNGRDDVIDIYLDSLYSAIRGKGGCWDKNYTMPKPLKSLIFKRPYFWADFISLRFGKIIIARLRKA